MAELPSIAKDWTGPIALAGLFIWGVVQITGVVPVPPPEGLAEDTQKQIGPLIGRIEDHNGRIERAWAAIRAERSERTEADKELRHRVSQQERVTDRLIDRLDDQRASMAAMTATLTSINNAVHEIRREQDVTTVKLNAIAQRVGVTRPPNGKH